MCKGMLLGTSADRSVQSTCRTNADCVPLCDSCRTCVCLNGFCVRGCLGPHVKNSLRNMDLNGN